MPVGTELSLVWLNSLSFGVVLLVKKICVVFLIENEPIGD